MYACVFVCVCVWVLIWNIQFYFKNHSLIRQRSASSNSEFASVGSKCKTYMPPSILWNEVTLLCVKQWYLFTLNSVDASTWNCAVLLNDVNRPWVSSIRHLYECRSGAQMKDDLLTNTPCPSRLYTCELCAASVFFVLREDGSHLVDVLK